MDKYLELCCELNDVLYESKIKLDRFDPYQYKIDKVMAKYQGILRELSEREQPEQIKKILAELGERSRK